MLERTRLVSKKISKTQSVASQIDYEMPHDDIHIGPSDHVPWLSDRKWALIRLEGRNFGDVPLMVELKLEVHDSPNSAGVIIDAVRCAKIGLDRGMALDHTYQLNFGGNMDFKNMLERKRLQSKKISKTQSVTSQIDQGISDRDVHIGPSDHVPWLDDRKWALIRLEGRNFGDVPLMVELKLEVHDSPNSAGVIIDAVRCAKIGLDRGMSGPLEGPSAYFMKSPGKQYRDEEAHRLVEAYANGELDLK
jgi:myo-inositol-1-phosphate synthase